MSDGIRKEITEGQIQFIQSRITDILNGRANYNSDPDAYLREVISNQRDNAMAISDIIAAVDK